MEKGPLGFPGGTSGKEPICQCRRCKTRGFDPWKDPLEEGMATHSSILDPGIKPVSYIGRRILYLLSHQVKPLLLLLSPN